jgi:hypothetical protein
LSSGTLTGCTQGDLKLDQYLCRDLQTGTLMRLGVEQQNESDEPPICVYDPNDPTTTHLGKGSHRFGAIHVRSHSGRRH